jgi:hypothetical protein
MNHSMKLTSTYRDIALIFFIVLIALLFRRYDAFTRPQLWAEDYNVYFLQVEDFGARSIIMPYGGYLHILPRLFSGLYHLLHISYFHIPRCYSFTELLFTFFIAVNLWQASGYLNLKNRIIYAVAFLFLPLGSDIFMNFTNINWIASLYLINFVFAWNTGYTEKYYYWHLVVLSIISLSGPFSVFLSPLILLLIIMERKLLTIKNLVPLIIILLGGCIQFIYIQFIDHNFYRGVLANGEDYHLFKLITNNMTQLIFLRENFMQWISPFKALIFSFIIFLFFVYFIIRCYVRVNNKRKYLLLLYGCIIMGAYIKSYWPNESRVLALENPRYYFIPFICIAWIIILALDKKIDRLFVAVYLAFFLGHSNYIQMPLPDKSWKTQIQEYYEGKRQEIEYNPEGWHSPVPRRK